MTVRKINGSLQTCRGEHNTPISHSTSPGFADLVIVGNIYHGQIQTNCSYFSNKLEINEKAKGRPKAVAISMKPS
jgi:hypothetical protein